MFAAATPASAQNNSCGTHTGHVFDVSVGQYDDPNSWQGGCISDALGPVFTGAKDASVTANDILLGNDSSGPLQAALPLTLTLGGTYTINGDVNGNPSALSAPYGLTVNGAGTFNVATITAGISFPAANQTLALTGGVTVNANFVNADLASIADGATLNIGTLGFDVSGLTLTGGSTIAGTGSVDVNNGQSPANITIAGSTVNLTGGGLSNNFGNGGTVTINGGSTVKAQFINLLGTTDIAGGSTELTIAGGSFFGLGTATIEDDAKLDTGTINSAATLKILSGAEVSAATATFRSATTVSNAKLDVSGDATVDATPIATATPASLTFDNGATGAVDGTLTIQNGATLTVQNNASLNADSLVVQQTTGTGSGTIVVQAGGQLTDKDATLGGVNATATVSGAGSSWTVTGDLVIGKSSSPVVTVSQGATLNVQGDLTLGENTLAFGTLNLSDTSTKIIFGAGKIEIGNNGGGAMSLTNGVVFSAPGSEVTIAEGNSAVPSTLTMSGTGTTFSTGKLTIGGSGTGSANVSAGATLSVHGDLSLGENANSNGSLTFDGVNTGFSIAGGSITVGGKGTGNLTVQNGMLMNATGIDVNVGDEAGGTGALTVTDAGTQLNTGSITIAGSGTGTMAVSKGAAVQTSVDATIGDESGSTGAVIVSGSNSSWSIASGLTIGGKGDGTLTIQQGGSVTLASGDLVIGDEQSGTGTLTLDGAASNLTFNPSPLNPSSVGEFQVGNNGAGTFGIQNGANLTTLGITVGAGATGQGQLNVTGVGSGLTTLKELVIGGSGTGALAVTGGAVVTSEGDLTFADQPNSSGTGTVDGESTLAVGGTLSIGHFASATLTIDHGSVLNALGDAVELGEMDGGAGTLIVQNSTGSQASQLRFKGDLKIGDAGAGELDLLNGGTATPTTDGTGLVEVALQNNSLGTLKIDGAGSSLRAVKLFVGGTDTAGGGTGGVTLTNGGTAVVSDTLGLWSDGTVTLDTTGTLTVGAPSAATAGAVTIGTGGTLAGDGAIVGKLVNTAGIVRPGGADGNGIGTLTIKGDYSQRAAGTLAIEVSPSAASLLSVNGAANLGGTLALAFDPGTYQSHSYTLVQATSIGGNFAAVTGTVPTTGISQSVDISAQAVMLDLGTGSPNNGGGGGAGTTVAPPAGNLYGNTAEALAFGATQFNTALLSHLNGGGMNGNGAAAALGPMLAQLGVADAGLDTLAELPSAVQSAGGWLSAYGSFLSLGSGPSGVSSDMGGVIGGLDVPVNDNLRAGLAAGFDGTTMTESLGASATVNTFRLALYGQSRIGPLRLSGIVGGGIDWIDTLPQTPLATALANYSGTEFNATAEAALPVPTAVATLTPHLGVQYFHLRQPGFLETGAGGADVAGEASSYNSLQPFAGVTVSRDIDIGDRRTVALSAHADYWRETLSNAAVVPLTAPDGTAFLTPGVAATRDRLVLGAEAQTRIAGRIDAYAMYEALTPTGNIMVNTIALGLHAAF